MPGRVNKVLVGIAVFATVAGLLFSASFLYDTVQIKNPIIESISAIAGVDRVELENVEGNRVVKVEFTSDADIVVIWPEIVEALTAISDSPGYFLVQVEGDGEAGSKLAQASVALELAIQEAVATGTYTLISSALAEVNEAYGVSSQASLSQELLLIKLADGAATIYKTISLNMQDRG